MDKIFLAFVLVVAGIVVGYIVMYGGPAPVNASLSQAELDRAEVMPMGDLVWETDPDAAFTLANRSGKPVLMLFTAEWCGPCRHMHNGALADGRVQRAIRDKYIPLYMDVSEPTDSPAQQMSEVYSGRGIPRLVVANPKGKAVTTQIGSMDSANFLRWIEQN